MRDRSHRGAETTARAIRSPADDPPLPLDAGREQELRDFGRAARQRRTRTLQIGSIRRKLQASARSHLSNAAELVGRRPDQYLDDEAYAAFRGSLGAALRELDQEQRLSELEGHAAVVNEPGTYGPTSANSWYRDLAAAATARIEAPDPLGARTSSDVDMSAQAVQGRLDRHARDVQIAVAKGDAYGLRCKAILNESLREEDPVQHRQRSERRQTELRAFGTGSGPGTTATAGTQAGAFVSPAFLVGQWAPYRSPIRAFADQAAAFPLPAWGMEVYLPTFTSADKAGMQTDGGSVAETVPATGFEGAKVETATGQLVLTKQWTDRMSTGGGAFDELIAQELNWRVDAEIGKYVINQALAGRPS